VEEEDEEGANHRMPESLRAFWRMVSLTAAKTRRMLEVSVAWVRLGVCELAFCPFFDGPCYESRET